LILTQLPQCQEFGPDGLSREVWANKNFKTLPSLEYKKMNEFSSL